MASEEKKLSASKQITQEYESQLSLAKKVSRELSAHVYNIDERRGLQEQLLA